MKFRSYLLIACLITGCSRQPLVDFTPPSSWVPMPPNAKVAGLTAIFVGQREEGDGAVSTISVSLAPKVTKRSGARDVIGAYLDGFWRADTNVFMGQELEALKLAGHTVHYDRAPAARSAPALGSTHTYFVMTEGGVYTVVYRTLSDNPFDIGQLLEDSLRIEHKDASYADEMAQYWIEAMARVRSGLRTNVSPSEIESGRRKD